MAVFLYGTLQDELLRERLLGRKINGAPAVLHGYELRSQLDSPLPAIVAASGRNVSGLLLTDLAAADIERLDAYEIPFDYNPYDCVVDVNGKQVPAKVYLPGPSVAVSGAPWVFADWLASSAALSREMAIEIGAFDPPLAGEDLRRRWHMIAVRAAARLRARAEASPAQVRYAAEPDDVTIEGTPRYTGDFFRFAQFDLTHKTFQDERSDPLERELFVGTDAAIVLPYDPKTDRVLLVEQLRMGPLLRGAQNPWTLEPIAGIVDGGETPEQAALREAQEEAGLTNITLEKMVSYYPSTGGSSDYFYCYLGLCDLPDMDSYTGGLASEAEDLRMHILSFDDAYDLIETGEANMGALITMLLWLSRNRDRLRGIA